MPEIFYILDISGENRGWHRVHKQVYDRYVESVLEGNRHGLAVQVAGTPASTGYVRRNRDSWPMPNEAMPQTGDSLFKPNPNPQPVLPDPFEPLPIPPEVVLPVLSKPALKLWVVGAGPGWVGLVPSFGPPKQPYHFRFQTQRKGAWQRRLQEWAEQAGYRLANDPYRL